MSKFINEFWSREDLEEQLKDKEAILKDLKKRYENYEFSDEQQEKIEIIAAKYTKKIMLKLTDTEVSQDFEILEKEQKLADEIFENSLKIVKLNHLNLLKKHMEKCESDIDILKKIIKIVAKEESD